MSGEALSAELSSIAYPRPDGIDEPVEAASFVDGVPGFIRDVNRAQLLTIRKQLVAGIRFLDFRVDEENDVWYGLATLRTKQSATDFLQDVKTFLDEHPDESTCFVD